MSATAVRKWGGFEAQAPGKWVLAGEHAVLRGARAVAMPHSESRLLLRYEPGPQSFEVNDPLLTPVVAELFAAAQVSAPATGRLLIESTIPFGAGLGSSAALCVTFTKWVSEFVQIPPSQWVEFATRLEDRFHGRSSGMDVATIAAAEPVSFIRGQGAEPLGLRALPRFTFHNTELRARTSDCVKQVEAYSERMPEKAAQADERMARASEAAIEGLRRFDQGKRTQGLDLIRQAMDGAHTSFLEWDLVPTKVAQMRARLLSEGALAVKLTGAGGGGFLVALWNE